MVGDVQKPRPPSLAVYAARLALQQIEGQRIKSAIYHPFHNHIEMELDDGSRTVIRGPDGGSLSVFYFAPEEIRAVIADLKKQVEELEAQLGEQP